MDDKQIVELYWARNESAIFETDRKYGRYCHYIAYRILHNDSDAEEAVNDTYLKIWNTIPPKRPELLKPYVGMLARQISLDAYDKSTAQKRGGQTGAVLEELSDCVSGEGAEFIDEILLQDALNRFLGGLPQETRMIFLRRYWYMEPIAEIAAEFGMKESRISVMMLRTRQKLKKFLEQEGFSI